MKNLRWTVIGKQVVPVAQWPDLGFELFDRAGNAGLLEELVSQELTSPTIVLGQAYDLVGIHGSEFSSKDRSNGNVLRLAESRGYQVPPPEVAIMMATQIATDDLDYPHIVVMHKPLMTGRLYLVKRNGQNYIDVCSPYDSDVWEIEDDIVFVFLVPKVN